MASCSFDTSTSGVQPEVGAATGDADLTVDAGLPFMDPAPMANLVYALPQSNIVIDGVIDEWQDFSWVDISSPADYRIVSGTAGDSSDLSATLAARWDSSRLYIAVLVTDDVYENNGSNNTIWQGDSIQVAFDMADNNGTPYDTTDDFEYGWARATGDAPASYRWIAPSGHAAYTAAPYSVIRTGTTTVYEVSLSPADLGLSAFSAATGDIAFSWIVTEADGSGRDGFLEWNSGMGYFKSPALFGTLRFHPDGP